MRLENIIALTNAKLLNDPVVSVYEEIVFDASKVKRGDIFIAFDTSSIEEALVNGAYAIIFENSVHISDDEVAWLQVSSLYNALLRLLRFRLVEKELDVYECDEITLGLAQAIDTDSKVIPLRGDMQTLVKQLWDIPNGSILLFCQKYTQKDLFTDVKELPHIHKYHIEIIEKTLFEISFIFYNIYYERVQLSPFFIPFLEHLLNFYVLQHIDFRIKKFEHLENFEIVFTNKNFQPQEFGSSERVLIFEQNLSLIEMELDFIQNHAPWAKMIYLLPLHVKDPKGCSDECFFYEKEDDVLKILQQQNFHFALIYGVEKTILEKNFDHIPLKQLTFDL
ncbi:MAG: hypothetical protein GXO11_03710 [Epsilonproteobacteria bacterium]|nr:hypothetical protein [Campylobacterota bacterium]